MCVCVKEYLKTMRYFVPPSGSRKVPPSERLPVRGGKWEEGVCDLVTEVLHPLGFRLLTLSKLPYLCEGDLHSDCFVLPDAILVLSKGTITC